MAGRGWKNSTVPLQSMPVLMFTLRCVIAMLHFLLLPTGGCLRPSLFFLLSITCCGRSFPVLLYPTLYVSYNLSFPWINPLNAHGLLCPLLYYVAVLTLVSHPFDLFLLLQAISYPFYYPCLSSMPTPPPAVPSLILSHPTRVSHFLHVSHFMTTVPPAPKAPSI